MKIEEIKELIQALEQSTLTSLEVSQGSDSVRLEKKLCGGSWAGRSNQYAGFDSASR